MKVLRASAVDSNGNANPPIISLPHDVDFIKKGEPIKITIENWEMGRTYEIYYGFYLISDSSYTPDDSNSDLEYYANNYWPNAPVNQRDKKVEGTMQVMTPDEINAGKATYIITNSATFKHTARYWVKTYNPNGDSVYSNCKIIHIYDYSDNGIEDEPGGVENNRWNVWLQPIQELQWGMSHSYTRKHDALPNVNGIGISGKQIRLQVKSIQENYTNYNKQFFKNNVSIYTAAQTQWIVTSGGVSPTKPYKYNSVKGIAYDNSLHADHRKKDFGTVEVEMPPDRTEQKQQFIL